MKEITIIIPFLNEKEEIQNTIDSIYQTANSDLFDIIAIDDCSTINSPVTSRPEIQIIKNKTRLGVDGCRQLGVSLAKTPYIVIIDAHMRFNPKWLEKLLICLKKEPHTIWCTTCLGLGYGDMNINKPNGKYYGADFLLINPNSSPDRPAREILEPKWKKKVQDGEYEIPCVLGANYGFSKDWFNYIMGFSGLQMWGSSEPFLSIKSWLAGGCCKITTDIEIGHGFRSNAPYTTNIWHLIYNKLFMCKTIFNNEFSDKMLKYFNNDCNFGFTMKEINKNSHIIKENQLYYNNIFQYSFYDYCDYFKIELP